MFQQNSDDKDSYIYFLAYVNKRAALTVIELSHVVSFEVSAAELSRDRRPIDLTTANLYQFPNPHSAVLRIPC